MPHARMAVVLMLAWFRLVCGAEGQEMRPSCRLCMVSLEKIVTMGDDGDGAVGWNQLVASDGSRYYVSHYDVPDQILVFGADGRFQEYIGKAGEGPGEFRAIGDMLVGWDGNLWLLDGANQRLSVVTRSGELKAEFPARFRFNPRSSLLLPDSSFIVNALVPSPSLIGLWTHRWHPVRGFLWSSEDERQPTRQSLKRRTYALDEDGKTFWTAWMTDRYRIERRSLETGRIVVAYEPSRRWFEEFMELPQPRPGGESSDNPSAVNRPQATITSIRMVDGRLWVLGYTGANGWERARQDGYADLGTYLDNVIDIFDPKSGTLLVSTRIDIEHTLLVTLMPGGRIGAQETNPLIDKTTIYAARLADPREPR